MTSGDQKLLARLEKKTELRSLIGDPNQELFSQAAAAIRRLSGEVEAITENRDAVQRDLDDTRLRYVETEKKLAIAQSQLSQAWELLERYHKYSLVIDSAMRHADEPFNRSAATGQHAEVKAILKDTRTFLNTQSEPEKCDG